MFLAFGSDDFDRYKQKENIKKLIEEIDLNLFVGNTLTESTVDWTYGTLKGPGGHPLEKGHQIIANKIYEHIRHLGWIS